jgi:hypothetical protein
MTSALLQPIDATVSTRQAAVLLTATIDPGSTKLVARNDPIVRFDDYRRALLSWRSQSHVPIVFCENSGYDLSSLRAPIDERPGCTVEFLSFDKNHHAATRGKGYAELELIRDALATSRVLASSSVIIKCTGRLIVPNACRVIRSITACDFDVMCTLKQNLSFADTRVFAATPRFLQDHLFPMVNLIDDDGGTYLEHAVACAVGDALAHRKRWRPFPTLPRIQGISGTHGKLMTDSTVTAAAKTAFNFLRNFVYRH